MKLLPPEQEIEKIETRKVLKALTKARAALAELKGVLSTIPNEQMLIDTLSLQEAKDSSAVENIVTTHDELYKSNQLDLNFSSAAAKEVHAYAAALKHGYREVQEKGLITINLMKSIQQIIEQNDAGIRQVPGTELKNDKTGQVIYVPPQDKAEIMGLLDNLEKFINQPDKLDLDPLVKMALIHHQFESIHPFYDGNGRTGRILNILYLIKEQFLGIPVLYISKYIIKHRAEYYRLLQDVRLSGEWEEWILYMLEAVKQTSLESIKTIKSIKRLMSSHKKLIRLHEPKIYSQDLINNIFKHPYTKIGFLMSDMKISRITAIKYLDKLVDLGLLNKLKHGRSYYYINLQLLDVLTANND